METLNSVMKRYFQSCVSNEHITEIRWTAKELFEIFKDYPFITRTLLGMELKKIKGVYKHRTKTHIIYMLRIQEFAV